MFGIGAIVSLCYVPGLTGAYIATQWPVLAVLLSFAFLRSGPVTAPHYLMLAFVAYAAVGLFFSPVAAAAVFGLWLVAITAACLWFGTLLTDVRSLYAGLAFGAGVSSLLAAAQYFGFTGVPMVSGAPAGLYVNSVQHGTVLALLVVALMSERMWFWAIPLVPGIALSHSRGAWIALFVGLVMCSKHRMLAAAVITAAMLFYFVSPISPSDAERMFIWRAAWDNLTWFGWGAGSFYTVLLSRDGGVTSFYPDYVHNDALQLAFEYGIGAVFMFVLFGCAVCFAGVRSRPVIVAFIAAGCYSMPLHMPVAAFLVFVTMGFIFRTYGLDERNRHRSRQSFVPWKRRNCSEAVSLAPHSATEGCWA